MCKRKLFKKPGCDVLEKLLRSSHAVVKSEQRRYSKKKISAMRINEACWNIAPKGIFQLAGRKEQGLG